MPPKSKKVKKSKPRKPQPLPRSVQALLKYLGGSDVKLGGARGGQPATLAPTSINIAVSQQQAQQQAQQQQFVQQRVAPKGQIIGQSPLTSVISQQPIIIGLPQRRSDVEENEKKIETQKDELNKRLGVIETSQREILQIANEAYPNVNRRRNIGDSNIFDGEIVASRGKRPQVEEPQFAGVQVGEQEPTEWTDITDQGIYQAGQYLANVTNPEMTAIERAKRRAATKPVGGVVRGRGRPSKATISASRPEYVKEFAEEVAQFKGKIGKSKQPTASDVSSLLESVGPSTIAGFTPVQSSNPEPVRRTIMVKKKPVSTTGAPDMATQIAMLTGGGAALPLQSKGQNIAELLGAKKK
jgi:hypothetical protein